MQAMYKQHKMYQKGDLKKLIFFITSKCNARCGHCFYWEELNQKEELSFDEIKKVADSIGELEWLYFSGGEPFIRREIIPIANYFIEKCHINQLIIPTNGTFHYQTIELIKQLSHKVNIKIHVSLDGLRETHDKIRGIKCFDKAIELMDKLKELKKDYNFKFNSMITVNKTNYDEIVPLGKFLNSKGFNFSVTPLRGSPKDLSLLAPTAEEWKDLIENLLKIDSFSNILGRMSIRKKMKMYMNALSGSNEGKTCEAGDKIAVLEHKGDMRICELTPKIGNVKDADYDFYKVWNGMKTNDLRDKVEGLKPEVCVRCTHSCFVKPTKILGLIEIK